jgi:hypothetical protein
MKTALLKSIFATAALSTLVACGETPDPPSRVTSLRVIAQSMDRPYAAPGESVQVQSLVHDPEGRPMNWAWATCLNPSSADVPGCIQKIAESGTPLLAMGEGLDTISATVPEDALSSLPIEVRSSATLGVLSVACPGALDIETSSTGLPFRCTESNSGRELGLDEFVVGVKRVVVRSSDRNDNPAIARITFDGAEWAEDDVPTVRACAEGGNDFSGCAEALQHRVAAEVTPESFERGKTEFGEPFEEQLVVQYFASEGIFASDSRIAKNPTDKWVPRKQAAGTDVTFWLVVRDNRGGVTWATRRAHVE